MGTDCVRLNDRADHAGAQVALLVRSGVKRHCVVGMELEIEERKRIEVRTRGFWSAKPPIPGEKRDGQKRQEPD